MNLPSAVVTAFVLTDQMPPIRTSDPWTLAELVMSATDPGPEVPPPLHPPRPGEPPTPIIPEPIIPDPLLPQPERPDPTFHVAPSFVA